MKKLLLTMIGALLAIAANAADWYLCGDNLGGSGTSNWNVTAKYKFTQSPDNANVFTYSISEISGKLKVRDGSGSWSTSFGSNGTKIKEGIPYKCNKNGADIAIDGKISDATITIDVSTYTMTITGAASENDYSAIYLTGDFGSGWGASLTQYPLSLTEGTTNVWEGSVELTASKNYFRLKAGALEYGPSGSDAAIALGTEYTAKQGGDKAYTLTPGKYNFSFILDKNAASGKLTITQDGPVTYPEKLYAIGNVNGHTGEFAANIAKEIPATGEEGQYQADITFAECMAASVSYFSLSTAVGTAKDDWSGLGTRYGAETKDLVPGADPVKLASTDFAWKVKPGIYTVTVNLVDLTMTVAPKQTPIPTPEQPLEVTFDFTSTEALAGLTPAIPAFTANDQDGWIVDTSKKENSRFCFNDNSEASGSLAKDNVTFAFKQNNPSGTSNLPCEYYTASGSKYDFRLYKNCVFSLTAPEGYVIEAVKWTSDNQNIKNFVLDTNEPGTLKQDGLTQTWTKPETGGVNTINFKLTGTVRIQTITVTLAEAAGPEPVYPDLYFRGANTSWDTCDETNKMKVEAGVYTISLAKLNGEFKIAAADWDLAAFSTKNLAMEAGTEYDVVSVIQVDNSNMAMAKSLKDVTVTFNYKTYKIKVEGTEYTPEVAYKINSNLSNADWSMEAMTKAADSDMWEYVVTPIAANGEMQVVMTEDGTAKSYLGNGEVTLSEATPEAVMAAGAANLKYKLTAGTEYKFTFDPATSKLTVATTAEPVVYPELYFRGASTSWDNCNETNKMTLNDDVYTFTLDKLNGEFKIAAADWDKASFSTKNLAMEAGTEYDVLDVIQVDNSNMAMAKSLKDVTVTFNYTTMKLKVEGTEYTPEVAYKINSNLSNENWSMEAMTKAAGSDMWEYVVTPIAANGEMQVVMTEDGTAKSYLGNGEVTLSETTPEAVMAAGAANLKYELTAGTEYKFTFDPATSKLTVATTAEPVVYPELYFRGAQNNWGLTDQFTLTGNIYTITLPALKGSFKIADEAWSAENSWTTNNATMELDTEYECYTEDNAPNMSMAKNLINATITFDYTTKKISVTGTIDDTPEVITYIIKGTFSDPAWDAKQLVKNDIDDSWSFTCPLAAATGELLVVQLNDGVEKEYFKATAADKLTATSAEVTLATTNGTNLAYDFEGADVNEITFTFTPATGSLKASWTTGIEGISADFDPNAEYYNMQGLRVAAPAPGLYIVVRGTTVTKEYLK